MIDGSKIEKGAQEIVKTLKNSGYQCFLVGGCVRDLLLGEMPHEWDLTTDAEPKVVSSLFHKVIPTGIKYGTVTVLLDEKTYEVTTFRKDEKYVDGRHPSNVKFTKKLDEDLLRRDFTINAMAFDPIDLKFVDLFSGQKDLQNKIIRAVGDPKARFLEDGLRPVRACRFAAQLEFSIEHSTFDAIGQVLQVVKKVAIERVHDELVKILKTNKPSTGIEYLRKAKILELFIPELVGLVGVSQPEEYHKHDVYWHSLFACDAAPKSNLAVRLAALLHDIAKPSCKEGDTFYNHDKVGEDLSIDILKRLKFSNEIIGSVSNLVSNHMFNYDNSWSDSAVRRFIRRVGLENIGNLFELRKSDVAAMEHEIGSKYLQELQSRIDKIIAEENALHVTDLAIDGKDVMVHLNIQPGPKVGQILEELLEKALDNPSINTREQLLEILRAYK